MLNHMERLLNEVYNRIFKFESNINGVLTELKRQLCNTPAYRLSDEHVLKLNNITSELEKIISSLDDSLDHLDNVIAVIK